ncbi:unnamed protein product [Phytophthora fragariaefolia]|uniref:Unnamed protein product n=1 Tax=Phytophthora fragariaefolia TaxID=1490495 RepID=A0A9W6XA79_9STRA|nr:unnamed protein product [Phytophthora fragariaefolia]
MLCCEKVHIDLQIVTAAGPLALTNIERLVLDAPEEELLFGKTTLQPIRVDLDGVFEQFAQQLQKLRLTMSRAAMLRCRGPQRMTRWRPCCIDLWMKLSRPDSTLIVVMNYVGLQPTTLMFFGSGLVMLSQVMLNPLKFDLRQVLSPIVAVCTAIQKHSGSFYGTLIQREWTVDWPVSSRNEFMHMDYLYLGESYGEDKYVLVLKNELAHYCELVAADSAHSQTTVTALLDWHKRFGIPAMWMSDNDTHFKCQVMEELAERLVAVHHFFLVSVPVTGRTSNLSSEPICPNQFEPQPGTLAGRLRPCEAVHWPSSAVCVRRRGDNPGQAAKDIAAGEGGFPQGSRRAKNESLWSPSCVRDRRERSPTATMTRSKGTVCNFSEGDYLLWSRVGQRL